MSRSPSQAVSKEAASQYILAFDRLTRLREEGRNFSGRERNCVYLNTGDSGGGTGGRFADISAVSGLDFMDDARGIAHVDWDHDGDLDLWIANRTAPQVRFMRNDSPAFHRFVAVRLEGRDCNRDGIGARVEVHLEGHDRPLLKTLYAGRGFLSQSSKWLHFGLGQEGRIEKLVVRWPGGDPEMFGAVAADGRYRLVQGAGEAAPWTPPQRSGQLVAAPLEAKEQTTTRRIYLAARPPIPELTYTDFSGAGMKVNEGPPGPTLVNLWASWCRPCHAELRQWTLARQQLRDVGLRVIALSVDGLDRGRDTAAEDAASMLEEIAFPFEGGMANVELLSKLQLLSDRLLIRNIQHAVPTSFLIDSEGRLAVIYRGPVELEELLADLRQLDVSDTRRRELATMFSGRWLGAPSRISFGPLGELFEKDGYLEDAVIYYRAAADDGTRNSAIFVRMGYALEREGMVDEAMAAYLKAIGLDEGDAKAHNNLGVLLSHRGQRQEAIGHFYKAVGADPAHVMAHFNLGSVLVMEGRRDGGLQYLDRAHDLAIAAEDPDLVTQIRERIGLIRNSSDR